MKRHLLFFVLILTGLTLMAKPVDPELATKIAKNFVSQYVKGAGQMSSTVVYTHAMPESGQPAMYVVNVGSMFVLVSADDVAHPVLGYSLSRPWPTKTSGEKADAHRNIEYPSQVTAYLDDLAGQIASASGSVPDPATAAEWQQLLSATPLATTLPDSVGPLLTTTWDQGQYYNDLCPEDAGGPDGHAYTGCVATAMAQIINYWGYPVHGRGTHSYNLYDYRTLTVNYDSANYDYANMPNALTAASSPAQVNAVAKLMFDCGVAANMSYGPTESSSFDIDARAGLINFFRISPNASYAEKAYFSNDEWNSMLRTDLGDNRVIMYSGHGTGGHTFVCDGYKRNGYFHFNFGWSGFADGWYTTNAVNPAGMDFNSSQTAVLGIVPDSTGNVILGQMAGTSTFIVDEPLEFHHLLGHNSYYGVDYNNSFSSNTTFIAADTTVPIVANLLNFEGDQAARVYYGNDNDYHMIYPEMIWFPVLESFDGTFTFEYSGNFHHAGFCVSISPQNTCGSIPFFDVTYSVDTNQINLSWTDNANDGWVIEYGLEGFTHGNGEIIAMDTTYATINNLLPYTYYDVYIKPSCVGQWTGPLRIKTDLSYWQDYVVEEPDGIVYNDEGYAIVSTPEQLTWLVRNNSPYEKVLLTSDIDMSGHRWNPVINWSGRILNGDNHSILNLLIRENKSSLVNHLGFIGDMHNYSLDTMVIRDLIFVNPEIIAERTLSDCGVLAGIIISENRTNTVINCGVNGGYIDCSSPFVGGLAGRLKCDVYNSYANISIHNTNVNPHTGGLLGHLDDGEIVNCYTNSEIVYTPFDCSKGQIIGSVEKGDINNIYGRESEYPLLPQVQFGDVVEVFSFGNNFNLNTGVVFEDSTYYGLSDVLNRKVQEYNDSTWRLWENDSFWGYPTLDELYQVSCNNVNNLKATNVMHEGLYSLKLEWDTSAALSYVVKCINLSDSTDSVRFYNENNNPCFITDLQLGDKYEIFIRCNCDSTQSGWGKSLTIIFDKPYWTDIVTSQPDGYSEDYNGNVSISSAEGLSWFASRVNGLNGNVVDRFRNKRVIITSDIDMGEFKWLPIGNSQSDFFNTDQTIEFQGKFDGNGHIISNLYVNEDADNVGFFGRLFQAKVTNVTIKNSFIKGRIHVGGLCGVYLNSDAWWGEFNYGTVSFDNCHVENTSVHGEYDVGGMLGLYQPDINNSIIRNCSSSGTVEGGEDYGGLIGFIAQLSQKYVENCFSSATVACNNENNNGCSYYGGLIGYVVNTNINNCYSAGVVDLETNGGYRGSMIGVLDNSRVNYLYGLLDTIHDMYTLNQQYSIQNTTMFYNANDQYLLLQPVAISSATYFDLLSALNAWVDANNTSGVYLHWAEDTANINSGFPVFEFPPCLYVTRTFMGQPIIACDSYTYNDVTYTESFTINDTLQTVNGCDSIVSQLILIHHPVTSNPTVHICEGQTYNFNGRPLTETNWYYDTIVNGAANGCDSIVYLWLEVQNPTSWNNARVCEGQSYTFNGRTLTETGSYYDTIVNGAANGCDSIVSLWLEVRNNYSYPSAEVCQGDSYSFAGQTLTESGTYYDTLTNTSANGCDSIVQLDLTVHPSYDLHDTVIISENALPYLYTYKDWTNDIDDFSVIMSDGTQVIDTRTNPSGTIYDNGGPNGNYSDNFDGTIILTADEGETIKLSGNHLLEGCCDYIAVYDGYGISGNNLIYTCSIGGVNIQSNTGYLTIRFTSDGSVNYDGFALQWNTQQPIDTLLTTAGDYTFEAHTSFGCDNTINLHLEPRAAYSRTDSVSLCSNSLPYAYADTLIADAGTYTFFYLDRYGIDSTVTLVLDVKPISASSEDVTACDSYTWHETTYTASGTPTYSTTNAVGCDSTVTLHLTINNPVHSAATQAACESYTWNGTAYTVGGDYTYSHADANGCTQVGTLHLTINNPVHTATTQAACESYTWNGSAYTASGDYTFSHADANGCTQVDTLHLTVNYSTAGDTVAVACDGFTWWNTNYTNSTNSATHVLTNAAGCDSTVTLHLTVNHSTETTVTDSAEGSYTWHGETYSESGTYIWTGTTADGCDSTVTLILTVTQVSIVDVDGTGLKVNVYPNPTTGLLTIEAASVQAVELFDLTGRKVAATGREEASALTQGVLSLDLGHLPAGSYLLKVYTPEGCAVQRVIVQ